MASSPTYDQKPLGFLPRVILGMVGLGSLGCSQSAGVEPGEIDSKTPAAAPVEIDRTIWTERTYEGAVIHLRVRNRRIQLCQIEGRYLTRWYEGALQPERARSVWDETERAGLESLEPVYPPRDTAVTDTGRVYEPDGLVLMYLFGDRTTEIRVQHRRFAPPELFRLVEWLENVAVEDGLPAGGGTPPETALLIQPLSAAAETGSSASSWTMEDVGMACVSVDSPAPHLEEQEAADFNPYGWIVRNVPPIEIGDEHPRFITYKSNRFERKILRVALVELPGDQAKEGNQ